MHSMHSIVCMYVVHSRTTIITLLLSLLSLCYAGWAGTRFDLLGGREGEKEVNYNKEGGKTIGYGHHHH